ncbi:MAG: universal stress protein [Bdellovibrionales bacterium]|nr:universal stress protein [Bdellovibrionales bacterium]
MKKKKIIWAVNPFRDNKKFRTQTGGLATFIANRAGLTIEPTFVANPQEIRVTFEIASLDQRKMLTFASQKLEESLPRIPTRHRPSTHVLYQSDLSISSSAQKLCKYASQQRAKFILTATHAQGGVGLLGIGSFTQALLSYADVPVVAVNPSHYRLKPLKRILFATDFSAASRRAFLKLCELAYKLKAEIVVCNIFVHPTFWVPDISGIYPGVPNIWESKYLDKLRADLETKTDRFAKLALDRGIRATRCVEEIVSGSIYKAILDSAHNHHVDMIAVAAESGQFTRGVLGTTAQRLVHHSDVPVWVYRP